MLGAVDQQPFHVRLLVGAQLAVEVGTDQFVVRTFRHAINLWLILGPLEARPATVPSTAIGLGAADCGPCRLADRARPRSFHNSNRRSRAIPIPPGTPR